MSAPHNPPSQDGSDTTSKPLSQIHALQLRAFLDAAEDVDVDPDTIEDLLDGLDEGVCAEMTMTEFAESDSETSDTEDLSLLVQEEANLPAVVGIGKLVGGDIDTSEIRAMEDEAMQAWTKDEIRKMMHHLKEHGMSSFIREYVVVQNIPAVKLLFAFGISLCPELRHKCQKTLLYFLRVAISRELHLREKLPQYNTVWDAIDLISRSKRIMVLTGAGISVSCGIPDFRSRDGLYAMLKEKGQYDLDDPQQMFDINYFRENPKVFYSFASQIYPSNYVPSPCHRFIKLLEDKNKLLRNYTQNIDTLESIAGVTRVLQCHGSFKTATCLQCRLKVPGTDIERDILDQRVPYCKVCMEAHRRKTAANKGRSGGSNHNKSSSGNVKVKKKGGKRKRNEWEDSDESDDELPVGVMKPDITFFGEKLTDDFDKALLDDRDEVDLLLVIGTSLKVSPVSEILSHLPHSVPQILINKTPVKHINPDIVLLGDADEVVRHLCQKLDWILPPPFPPEHADSESGEDEDDLDEENSSQTGEKRSFRLMMDCRLGCGGFGYYGTWPTWPKRVLGSHVWLFKGAEGGKWVEDIKERYRSNHTNMGSTSQQLKDNQGQERDTKKPRVR